jgi:hypothetical protein
MRKIIAWFQGLLATPSSLQVKAESDALYRAMLRAYYCPPSPSAELQQLKADIRRAADEANERYRFYVSQLQGGVTRAPLVPAQLQP